MDYVYPLPAAYHLDARPVPRCIIEITSPDSHVKDLRSNVPVYLGLETGSYLVIDAMTPSQKLRDPVELHLWRQVGGKAGGKVPGKVPPDAAGYLPLPEMGLDVGAFGQRLVFVDTATGLVLPDSGELRQALAVEARRADVEARRAATEARRAEIAERQARSAFSAGEKEQAVRIARRMLAGGLDTAAIAEFTGLSPADLGRDRRERRPCSRMTGHREERLLGLVRLLPSAGDLDLGSAAPGVCPPSALRPWHLPVRGCTLSPVGPHPAAP